jgi:large subunit ribosomal protein L17
MRHGVKLNPLGRKSAHRKAMLSNMASQLIQYKRITTTLAKAKALRIYVEPLLTRSKNNTTHNRRTVFSYLQNKESIIELFDNISQKIADRPGGYTRIIKLPMRAGDAADMALIELVDYNEMYTGNVAAGADKKKTRRSRGAKKETTAAAAVVAETESPVVAEEATPVAEAAPEVEATPVVEATPEVEATPVVEATPEVVTEAVVEETPAAEEVTPLTEEASATTSGTDDLTIVEGIGPKIAALLNAKGITSFTQLAATSLEDINAILAEAGPIYQRDASTWAQQSQMAAEGKFTELKAWQDELQGGSNA